MLRFIVGTYTKRLIHDLLYNLIFSAGLIWLEIKLLLLHDLQYFQWLLGLWIVRSGAFWLILFAVSVSGLRFMQAYFLVLLFEDL